VSIGVAGSVHSNFLFQHCMAIVREASYDRNLVSYDVAVIANIV
jgi:hypothetical protein